MDGRGVLGVGHFFWHIQGTREASKIPLPSKVSSNEVLPNCPGAGEPFSAYGLTHLFRANSSSPRKGDIGLLKGSVDGGTRDVEFFHGVGDCRVRPCLEHDIIKVVSDVPRCDTTTCCALCIRLGQLLSLRFGVVAVTVLPALSSFLPAFAAHCCQCFTFATSSFTRSTGTAVGLTLGVGD